jgi:HSP20 family protein
MATQNTVPVKREETGLRRAFAGPWRRDLDWFFDDIMPSFAPFRQLTEQRRPMDLAETKDGLELTVELPGLDVKDVEISVSDGVLTVKGEKSFDESGKDKHYHFVERGYGAFSRSIRLPPGAKVDGIKATMDKGVLTVEIPAAPPPSAQTIAIQAAS